MAPTDGDRTRFWPAIEARYGRPMREWFALLAEQEDQRYSPLMSHLQEEHGFSRAHANALVQYVRGSVTSQRSTTLEGYLASAEPVGAATVRRVFDGLLARHPGTTVEITRARAAVHGETREVVVELRARLNERDRIDSLTHRERRGE
jgi:hypothetical protein